MTRGIVAMRSFLSCSRLAAAAACAALAACLACGGGSSPSAPTPTSSTPALDPAFALARQQPNITSLVVSRDGTIVGQEYFHGGGPDTPQDVRSVTKSVMSLVVGVALSRGCLASLDQTVSELLGPLGPSDPAKGAVTLRHLLTMSSGIGGDELADPDEYNRWWSAPNQLAHLWSQPLVAPPGSRFAYYSPAYSALSPIVTRACGKATASFASDYLFAPLGIGPRAWETDHQGYANGAAGVLLAPTDMQAIGNLVLAGGAGIVPAGYFSEATRPQMATHAVRYVSGYGYGWWTGQVSGSDVILAHGWAGQFIVVVPRLRLVVTAADRWQGLSNSTANAQWLGVADIIMQHVVPAFQP